MASKLDGAFLGVLLVVAGSRIMNKLDGAFLGVFLVVAGSRIVNKLECKRHDRDDVFC